MCQFLLVGGLYFCESRKQADCSLHKELRTSDILGGSGRHRMNHGMQVHYYGLFLIGLMSIHESYGHCFQDKAYKFVYRGYSKDYCIYKGKILVPGWDVKFPAPYCVNCTCKSTGLQCCGYGAAAGVVSVPPNTKCEPIKDGCEMKWVYRDNQSKECAKEDMP